MKKKKKLKKEIERLEDLKFIMSTTCCPNHRSWSYNKELDEHIKAISDIQYKIDVIKWVLGIKKG